MRTRTALILSMAIAACGRSESAKRERCRALAVSRNELQFGGSAGASVFPVGDGKVLLELLRCDLGDTVVYAGALHEMSELCGASVDDLIEKSNVDIDDMFPRELLARADEAGCGELRQAGKTIFAHPAVKRALADLKDTKP